MKKRKMVAPLLSLAIIVPAALNVYAQKPAEVETVDFISMDAPKSAEELSTMYSHASAVITYNNGVKETVPLEYKTLFKPGNVINGKIAGSTFDANGNVITDPNTGLPFISKAPDSNSLLSVNGKSGKLYLLNHYESVPSTIGNLPKALVLNTVEQDKKTGELKVTDINPVNFSGDGGIWTPCARFIITMEHASRQRRI